MPRSQNNPADEKRAAEEKDGVSILRRAQAGDQSALPALREMLNANPTALSEFGNPASMARESLLRRAAGENLLLHALMERRLARVCDELAGPDPTPLERLLAERAALCWLDVNTLDAMHASDAGRTFQQAEYHDQRRERAQRRFLAAVKTLAQIRKLALPAIQVNIGHNQVNVAGG